MADDLFTDTSTAVDEPGWGGGGVVDTSGDGMHITDPAERRKYKERSRKHKQRWVRAQAIRDSWSESDFEAERQRLQQEVEAILAAREEERRHAA